MDGHCRRRRPSSSLSSSASSLEALNGGNSNEKYSSGLGPLRSYNGSIMDNGRSYSNNRNFTPSYTSSSSTAADTPSKIRRPQLSPRKQSHRSIIDLCSSDDEEELDERRKRSLHQQNNNNGYNYNYKSVGSGGNSPSYSPPMRQKRPRQHQQRQQRTSDSRAPPPPPPVSHISLPSRKTRDGATITFGLLSLLDLLKNESNTLTTEGSITTSISKLYKPLNIETQQQIFPWNHQPYHYLQSDNWSCGYRNLQMLISSMLPTLTGIFPGGVPNVEEIQRTMEILWSCGFDGRNAEHHCGCLVGKKTWIGTVEVWSYLSFKRVDSIIVQFIKKEENRALLGKFVWAYFNRVCGSFGCSCCDQRAQGNPLATPSMLASEYADYLLLAMRQPNFDTKKCGSCKCSLPPLYLQWDGHSVTVVGVKRILNAYGGPPSYTLIVFCPQKKLGSIKGTLARELQARNTTPTTTSYGGQQRSSNYGASAASAEFGDSRVNPLIELPANKMVEKDCQVLLCTARKIDETEKHRRKSCVNHIGFLNASLKDPLNKLG